MKGIGMYNEHPIFLAPEDENISMAIYGFYEVRLDKRSLHFCRVDKLGDPFEGSVTEMNVKAREEFLDNYWIGKIDDERLAELHDWQPRFNKKVRQGLFINCWHIHFLKR
jgi:hypothetical protein